MQSAALMQNIKQFRNLFEIKDVNNFFSLNNFYLEKKRNNMDTYQYVISNLKH